MKDSVSISKILSRVLLFSIMVSIVCLYAAKDSEASTLEEREKIASLGVSKEANLITLNNYLSAGDILNYFKIYQKLSLLSYEELNAIKERLEKINSAGEY